jgi:hypothetical protein
MPPPNCSTSVKVRTSLPLFVARSAWPTLALSS